MGSYWRRKGTGQADSILRKKEISVLHFQWTLHYVPGSHGIMYPQPNWPPRLINTRFHTKISCCQRECTNSLHSGYLCNFHGTHWLQCITLCTFWLCIMAVTMHLPLTLSRLGLRKLGMWAWTLKVYTPIHICGCTLKVYKVFIEVGQCSWLKRKLCLGPAGVINYTPLSTLSCWVSLFPRVFGYNNVS